jgi:UDP-N-acetylmuramyl tripeptide synthase
MNVSVVLAITKTAAKLSRLFGRGGGQALPGLLAERLDPLLAQKLAAGLPQGVILVTGTNGKTTTTKLIAEMLEAQGERVLVNATGSNLKRGVTSALIAAADLTGKIDATVGLFEVDEASLRRVAPLLQPQHIVVLNLFRDQLDRYGELDTTAALIGQGIAATQAQVYLNADDPLVASLAKYAAAPELVRYFGVEGLPSTAATAHQTATDSDRSLPVPQWRLCAAPAEHGDYGSGEDGLGRVGVYGGY